MGVKDCGGAFFLRGGLLCSLCVLLVLFALRLLPLLCTQALLSVHQALGRALPVLLGLWARACLAGEAGWRAGVGGLLSRWGLAVLLDLGPRPGLWGGLGPGSIRVFTLLLRLMRILSFLLSILGGCRFCPLCRNEIAKSDPKDQAAHSVSPEPQFRSSPLCIFTPSPRPP